MTFSRRALAILFLAAPALAGCATYDFSKPPPAQSQPIAVTVSGVGPSGWTDLPIGVYRIPSTNVIIAGHQSGAGIGMMFGVVGVLAADAIGTAKGKRAVGDAQDALQQVDLVPQANDIARQALASGRYGQAFATAADAAGPVLEVTPYTVITFANDTEVRPYVILKASLKPSAAGKASWTTRYIASTGAPLPLAGDNSLTADSGKLLKSMLTRDLTLAINAMLDDVATRRGRDDNRQVYVETAVPYVKQRFALTGLQLADDSGALVFLPHVADANVFAGVEIVDDTVAPHRPAAAEDKIKLLDDK